MQNQNNSLGELVTLLEKQDKLKKDFVAPSTSLHFTDGKLMVTKDKVDIIYTPTKVFHAQVCGKLEIPKTYYDKMLNVATGLLDNNVNHWLKGFDKSMLVRTFEDENKTARAFLSDRYSMVDNYEILFETLEAIRATGIAVEVQQAELSENRMYLKVVCPEIEVKATELLKQYARTKTVGDGVMSGFVLSNSEIGMGAFNIMPRAVILACNNGLVVAKDALKRIHLGASMEELDFSKNSAVKQANIRLIKEQVKHAVSIFLSKKYLEKTINLYTELGNKEITAPVANVIEVVSKEFSLSDERKSNILNYFIKGADTRRIGLVNAITEECQTLLNPDDKHDSEVMSYDVLHKMDRIEAAAMKTKFTVN